MNIFGQKKAKEVSQGEVIQQVSEEVSNLTMEDLEKVEKLADIGIKAEQLNAMRSKTKLDPNVVLSSVVGLTSVLLVLNYEKADVVTSKAFGMAQKLIGR